eukprot:scaffold5630_cov17-Tisochrysis_lutea.AAC.3
MEAALQHVLVLVYSRQHNIPREQMNVHVQGPQQSPPQASQACPFHLSELPLQTVEQQTRDFSSVHPVTGIHDINPCAVVSWVRSKTQQGPTCAPDQPWRLRNQGVHAGVCILQGFERVTVSHVTQAAFISQKNARLLQPCSANFWSVQCLIAQITASATSRWGREQ